jgi:hypothetical protein
MHMRRRKPQEELALTPVRVRAGLAQGRLDSLRAALPGAAAFLKRRRADLLKPDEIADYVALDWLSWEGGGLKLTATGENICAQSQRACSTAA